MTVGGLEVLHSFSCVAASFKDWFSLLSGVENERWREGPGGSKGGVIDKRGEEIKVSVSKARGSVIVLEVEESD